jgi:integrase/recombinase XerD
MAVYHWCSKCQVRAEICPLGNTHKAQRLFSWRVDVRPGGRSGPDRYRETFSTKEHAEARERELVYLYEHGQLFPKSRRAAATFKEIADEWLTRPATGTRKQSIQRSERYRVAMFLEAWGARPLGGLAYSDIEELVDERLSAGRAIGTVNRDLSTIQSIMNYAVTKGAVPANPFAGFADLEGDTVRVRWLTEEEVLLLCRTAAAMDPSLVDLILVAINTGFRKGNLERLSARDLNGATIAAAKTKSGRPYDVPLTATAAQVLARLVNAHPTGPLLDTVKLDARFRAVATAAGLYTTKTDPNKVTLHTLRHTYAAHYLKRGGDIYRLSKFLGHSSVQVTQDVYGHLCPRDQAAQAPLLNVGGKIFSEPNGPNAVATWLPNTTVLPTEKS